MTNGVPRHAQRREGTGRISKVVLLAIVAWTACGRAQTTSPGEPWRAAEAAVKAAVARQHVSGLSVAVVVDDRIGWSRAYGFADLENPVPFSTATVWRLGSVSKPITAIAAMQLSERGRLDLDVPIQKYCPAFPEKQRPITSRQLLGHLSGIRHYNADENFNSTRHYDGVVASLDAFKNDPLVHDPGTAFTYSTYGYVVLGCVVEGASGIPYAEYVRDNIWTPAGMSRTSLDDVARIIPNRARGYAHTEGGEFRNAELADTSNKIPGGGLVSTAEDLARLAIALDTHKLLKEETYRRMQVPMKTADGKESPYFGFNISDRKKDKVLSHGGGQQGTSTFFLLVPARHFAVAVIANTSRINAGEIANAVADAVLP
jgi:serine beta-lactamase-like protein LACTB